MTLVILQCLSQTLTELKQHSSDPLPYFGIHRRHLGQVACYTKGPHAMKADISFAYRAAGTLATPD